MNVPLIETGTVLERIRLIDPVVVSGHVTQLVGLVLEAGGIIAGVGEVCLIDQGQGAPPIQAEVIGFTKGKLLLMPFHHTHGIRAGQLITPTGRSLKVPVGTALLGRVLDGLGNPIDDKGPLRTTLHRTTNGQAPAPLERTRITDVLSTGVKAIDSCITCGRGQRLGIFSGSGVGKSTLLGMICRNAAADINVIAMIGERGREIRESVDNNLGPEGLAKSVVVAVTSDETPLMRIKGAETAMTIAEYYRDLGKNVVFIMDSVTRYAMALREVGVSAGEVPTSRGYTPSVFARLPHLLERAGTSSRGTITGFYSVLIEGDDIKNDPVTDAIRAILDGHVMLDRALANNNIFPAIDILQSISRLARDIQGEAEVERMNYLLDLYATYMEAEDLINIGAYVRGSSAKIDAAIDKIDQIRGFIKQGIHESFTYEQTESLLAELTGIK